LRAQYRSLSARRGHQRAIVAVANSLLTAVYYILRKKVEYRELGANYLDLHRKESLVKSSIKRLEKLGYQVTLRPVA
jgi:transposase